MLKLETTGNRLINGVQTPAKVYRNTVTGGEVVIYLLYTDSQGNRWYTFEDLFGLPFVRQLAAKKVLDLYGHGLALEDIKGMVGQLKAIVRSNDAEKNDKLMAKLLEIEGLAEMTADPVRQCIGLCTVYLLYNDEIPDTWTTGTNQQKMSILSLDIDLQSFFLNWWTDIMRRYGSVLKGFSRIVSTINQSPVNDGKG